jgi:sialic acid synthase SpsE
MESFMKVLAVAKEMVDALIEQEEVVKHQTHIVADEMSGAKKSNSR